MMHLSTFLVVWALQLNRKLQHYNQIQVNYNSG
jgi:hypothetical protein